MKYNITINQYKLSENDKITIQDASVIDWLFNMFGSDSDRINKERKDGWTWISLPHLMEDMPLLRIESNSGASKLIKRIKDFGYIETKTDRKESRLYARATNKLRELYFSKSPKTRPQVPEDLTQVPQDTNHNTNNIILESKPPKVADKPFHFEEEMQKLLESKWKPDRVRWLYFTKKKFRFENHAQMKTALQRNLRPAQALEGYDSDQVEKAIEYCEENYTNIPWTLETLIKVMPHVVNRKNG